jgi:translation initiation factor IF-2
MYETRIIQKFDWNTEVNVNITMKELAVMYSLLCKTSTNVCDMAVKNAIRDDVDVYTGDVTYKMYDDIQKILKNNGVEVID